MYTYKVYKLIHFDVPYASVKPSPKQGNEHIITSKSFLLASYNLCLPLLPSSTPCSQATNRFLSLQKSLYFLDSYVNGIIQCVVSFWFFCTVILRSNHVVTFIRRSFLFIAEEYCITQLCQSVSICLSINGLVGCFELPFYIKLL